MAAVTQSVALGVEVISYVKACNFKLPKVNVCMVIRFSVLSLQQIGGGTVHLLDPSESRTMVSVPCSVPIAECKNKLFLSYCFELLDEL